jgi:hypothetical protein
MRFLSALASLLLLTACGEAWNNPYPAAERGKNILYSAFTERPKHLDPVQSYSENEAEINAQIYEAPLQYHYLKRPYTLIPATATEVPKTYLDAKGKPLAAWREQRRVQRVQSINRVSLPAASCLRQRRGGGPLYQDLSRAAIAPVWALGFGSSGTRGFAPRTTFTKWLAHPRLHSPIFGFDERYIVGLKLADTLKQANLELQRTATKMPGSISPNTR